MPFSIFFANLGKNLRFSCWQGKKNAIQAAIASIRGVLCIILAHNVPLPRRSRSSISFGIRVQKLIKNAEFWDCNPKTFQIPNITKWQQQ